MPTPSLDRLSTKVTYLDPREQSEEYRLSEEKRQFDSETFGFYQTYLNVPVWRAGLKVTVARAQPGSPFRKHHPRGVNAKPPKRVIDRYRKLFEQSNLISTQHQAALAHADLRAVAKKAGPATGESAEAASAGGKFLRGLLSIKGGGESKDYNLRIIRGRFWIYQYDAAERLPEGADPGGPVVKVKAKRKSSRRSAKGGEIRIDHTPLRFDIPDVDNKIKDGAYYMVAEVTLS